MPSPLAFILRDPLILDLDGDGIEVSALAGSGVHFDYGYDGAGERTGWVSPDDGLLAIDVNANGRVDGAAELFGSATQDGFAVLETFDLNGDGVIDANDAVFSQLRVWRTSLARLRHDLNQNGVSDAGELQIDVGRNWPLRPYGAVPQTRPLSTPRPRRRSHRLRTSRPQSFASAPLPTEPPLTRIRGPARPHFAGPPPVRTSRARAPALDRRFSESK